MRDLEASIESAIGFENQNDVNSSEILKKDMASDSNQVEIEGYAFSTIGKHHIEHGIPCQDSSTVYVGSDYGVAVISDGHSDYHCFRSNIGSQIATDVAASCIKSKLEEGADLFFDAICDDECRELIYSILAEWRSRIQIYDNQNPVSDDEWSRVRETLTTRVGEEESPEFHHEFNIIVNNLFLRYGCTLRIGVLSAKGYLAVSIGDGGTMVLLPDGKTIFPLPPDEANIGSETYSMCDPDADSLFKFKYELSPMLAISVMSDGISYFCTENDEHYYLSEYFKKIILSTRYDSNWPSLIDEGVKDFAINVTKDDASISFVSFNNFNEDSLKTKTIPLVWDNIPSIVTKDVKGRIWSRRIKYGFIVNAFDEESYRSAVGVSEMIDLLKPFCETFADDTEHMSVDDAKSIFSQKIKLLLQQWNRNVVEYDDNNPESEEEMLMRLTNHLIFPRDSVKYGLSMAIYVNSGNRTYATLIGKGKLVLSGRFGYKEVSYENPKSTANIPFKEIIYFSEENVERITSIGIDGTSNEKILL